MAHDGVIPPFIADNPSVEVAGYENEGNSKYGQETELIHQLTTLMDRYYSKGAPAGLTDAIFEEATKSHDRLASAD